MTAIKSTCIRCGQHIEHPRDLVGDVVRCPTCGKETLLDGPPLLDGTLWNEPLARNCLLLFVLFLLLAVADFHNSIQQEAALEDALGRAAFRSAAILALLAFYLLPTLVARQRRHHNTLPIFLLNLLLGWTVLGWLAALIWSVCRPAPR